MSSIESYVNQLIEQDHSKAILSKKIQCFVSELIDANSNNNEMMIDSSDKDNLNNNDDDDDNENNNDDVVDDEKVEMNNKNNDDDDENESEKSNHNVQSKPIENQLDIDSVFDNETTNNDNNNETEKDLKTSQKTAVVESTAQLPHNNVQSINPADVIDINELLARARDMPPPRHDSLKKRKLSSTNANTSKRLSTKALAEQREQALLRDQIAVENDCFFIYLFCY